LILCQLEELAIQWDVLQCGGLLFKGPTKCKKGLYNIHNDRNQTKNIPNFFFK
jgi:hypothetical protein